MKAWAFLRLVNVSIIRIRYLCIVTAMPDLYVDFDEKAYGIVLAISNIREIVTNNIRAYITNIW
jgi:hypothetical protein